MQTSVKRERPKQKSVWQGLSQHTLGGMFAMHEFLNSPYQLTLMLSLCIYYLCLTHCILREPMYGHLWYYWLNVFLTLLWLFVCIYFIFPYFFCTFPMKYNTNYPKGVLIWFQNRHMVVNSVIQWKPQVLNQLLNARSVKVHTSAILGVIPTGTFLPAVMKLCFFLPPLDLIHRIYHSDYLWVSVCHVVQV